MARGTISSFYDALQGLAIEVAALAASPDADRQWIVTLLDAIHDKLSAGGVQAPGVASPVMGGGNALEGGPAPEMTMGAGGPGSQPMSMGDMSRGPTPGPDMAAATGELQRLMAGR